MNAVSLLRGWHWRPTWTLAPDSTNPDPKAPWIRTWSGREYLYNQSGQQICDPMNGTGWAPGSGAAVWRNAPPPDRPVPTDTEMAAARERRGLPPLAGGAA